MPSHLLSSPFQPEPPYRHGEPGPASPRTAVLWCNLGTPDAPTAAALRPYLREFLSDHRVIEIPKLAWWPILHGIILRLRPSKSAAKYASIWTPQGSPLRVYTERQAKLLQAWLSERGHHVTVRYAMRYGQPSIAAQLDALKAQGIERILILPAYPQYSGTSTASVIDAVSAWTQRTRSLPELRFVNRYHDDALYIAALATRVRAHWASAGPLAAGEQLVLSFHSVPERTRDLGDPYHCECLKTARLLAEALSLRQDQWRIGFQSRLGRAKWLEPSTESVLRELGSAKTPRVDVFCPGFTSDCLETLEEIAMEGRDTFIQAGGGAYHYVACLNDDPVWIDALGTLAQRHLAGWALDAPSVETLDATRERALGAGAAQ